MKVLTLALFLFQIADVPRVQPKELASHLDAGTVIFQVGPNVLYRSKHIPGATFTEPDGGYFLWVDLPSDVNVDKLFPAAMKKGVAIVKGSDFLLEGGRHSVRLAFSAVLTDQVDEGVQRQGRLPQRPFAPDFLPRIGIDL